MDTRTENRAQAFTWTPQPAAARFIDQRIESFCRVCPPAQRLAERMRDETGTRFVDWVDHLGLAESGDTERELRELGFVASPNAGLGVWQHPLALFPTIHFCRHAEAGLGLRVESVVDFLAAQQIEGVSIEGEPLAALRKTRLYATRQAEFWVLERHGAGGFDPQPVSGHELRAVLEHGEAFRRRARHFDQAEVGFEHAQGLIEPAIAALGVDRTCDLFFAAEREYWQRRNRGGWVQRARQDALGLGWANHDHHTYRSSRQQFGRLIAIFEQLGFECRERFYGGREAGWGAQVLEQPACGVVIFADVDLTPEEVTGDFAHEPLAPRDQLGTVGLWCRLHGEAFLEAGMHHLECRFDFDRAREQLAAAGVESMKPFTDFMYLKQAFTKADQWPIDARRIDAALAEKVISREQAQRFREAGALGSHLEILERNDGYKGFNQTGINEIIRETDPRRAGDQPAA
jgi:hypothetical protein